MVIGRKATPMPAPTPPGEQPSLPPMSPVRRPEYAGDIKDRVSGTAGAYASSAAETARSYASTVADYAGEARQTVVSQTSRLADQASNLADQAGSAIRSGAGSVMREQPLAVAVLGMAAGAAVAGFFPTTEIEQRTLRPARTRSPMRRHAWAKTSWKPQGKRASASSTGASDRGLDVDGVKEMAREAGEAFTEKMSGKAEEPKSPSLGFDGAGEPETFARQCDPRKIMTGGELNRLEREVEEARKRRPSNPIGCAPRRPSRVSRTT